MHSHFGHCVGTHRPLRLTTNPLASTGRIRSEQPSRGGPCTAASYLADGGSLLVYHISDLLSATLSVQHRVHSPSPHHCAPACSPTYALACMRAGARASTIAYHTSLPLHLSTSLPLYLASTLAYHTSLPLYLSSSLPLYLASTLAYQPSREPDLHSRSCI